MELYDYNFKNPNCETANWKRHNAEYVALSPKDPKELGYGGRDYQIRRRNALAGHNITLTIAPTGCGKSLMLVFDAAIEVIESSYKQKQVFVVPQVNIGNGFTENKHSKLKIGNKVYDWLIEVNCLDGENSVAKIKKFLLEKKHHIEPNKKNDVLGGVTAICTYQAIIAAFTSMTKQEKKFAIKNTSFRVDEAHHIKGINDSELSLNDLNCMGKLIKLILDHNGSIHLTTATYFRGDRNAIIHGKYYDMFKVFRIPFLEHWDNLNLKEFNCTYPSYKNEQDLMNQILKDIRSEKEPSLIIVPSDGTKFFKKCNKFEWVKKLVLKLEKIYGPENVLDLVTERQDKDKKRFTSDEQDFKVVVTCAIGREGSDWTACSRIFNTVLDQSVLMAIQKNGRVLRAHPGKTDVRIVNYIEHFGKWDDEPEKVRQKISDRLNCVIMQSIMDDDFFPIVMPVLSSDSSNPNNSTPQFVTLTDLFGDKRNDVIKELMEAVLAIPEEARTGETFDAAVDQVIEAFSEDMLESVDFEELKQRLRKELVRRLSQNGPNLKLDGVIVDFIRKNGFDKVVRESLAHGSIFIGRASTDDMKRLQNYLTNDWMVKFNEVKRLGLRNIINNKADYPELYRFSKHNTKWIKANNA